MKVFRVNEHREPPLTKEQQTFEKQQKNLSRTEITFWK